MTDKPVVLLKSVTINKFSHRLDNFNVFHVDYVLHIRDVCYFYFYCNFEEVSFFSELK